MHIAHWNILLRTRLTQLNADHDFIKAKYQFEKYHLPPQRWHIFQVSLNLQMILPFSLITSILNISSSFEDPFKQPFFVHARPHSCDPAPCEERLQLV